MNSIKKLEDLAVILWKILILDCSRSLCELKLWFMILLLHLRKMKLFWRILFLNQSNYSTKSQPIYYS